jgi:8-oxo-dGTP diphosphatase
MSELRVREAVRALVIDGDERVLLVRFDFPTRTVWAIPGGGIDPGESDHDALHRELLEEIGLENPEIGPHLWNRLHIFPFINGLYDGQRERAYLVRVPSGFEPQPQFSWEQLNAEYLFEIRWWTVAELRSASNEGEIVTAPRQLAMLVEDLLANGPPPVPPDVDA